MPSTTFIRRLAAVAALAATASYELSEESMRLLDGADIPLVGLIKAKE